MGEIIFTTPVNNPIRDPYGTLRKRKNEKTGEMEDYNHSGIDYKAGEGTLVVASEDGKAPFVRGGRKAVAFIILSIILFLAPIASAGEKQNVKATQGEEILVEHGVSNRRPIWCGRKAKLVYSVGDYDEGGQEEIFFYDIETGRKAKVAEGISPIACSSDGEWLVYIDKGRLPRDKGFIDREVIDVWRYEFKTNSRQRFAVAYYDEITSIGDAVFSPAGAKVFLGKQPQAQVKMSAPEWDVVWGQKKANLTAWFHDSTAVARVYSNGEKDGLLIESFSPKKIILLEQRAKSILYLLADGQDNLYMQVSNAEFEQDLINEVVRCTIDMKGKELSCTPVLEDFSIKRFDVLSNGEAFVFTEWRMNGCVKRLRTGEEASCITKTYDGLWYDLKISPDERWIYFMPEYKTKGEKFANDLYLLRLKD